MRRLRSATDFRDRQHYENQSAWCGDRDGARRCGAPARWRDDAHQNHCVAREELAAKHDDEVQCQRKERAKQQLCAGARAHSRPRSGAAPRRGVRS
jgi:hypothetical protein